MPPSSTWQEGERKLAEKARMADALSSKVRSCDNPWQTLSIKYGNNRGKLFTEEEDRFLVCMTHELGYGKWDELKREVRMHAPADALRSPQEPRAA